MVRFSLLALCGVLCASCSAPVPLASVCPIPRAYTAPQEKQAQAEYDVLAPDAMLRIIIDDYGTERAELRACRH